MKTKKKPSAEKIVDDIKNRLDSIEELMYWSIRADSRFWKGQRVRLSPFGRRRGFKFKGGVTKGRVVKVGGSLSVTVLIDGYKAPKSFFHGFLEPVR